MKTDQKLIIAGPLAPAPNPKSQLQSSSLLNLDLAQDLMKNMTIRATPCTDTAALGNVALIPHSKRSSLSDKEKTRLISEIETGLAQKFTAVNLNRLQSEDAFKLGHTALLAQQINSVFDHLIKYNFVHVLSACPLLNFDQQDPALQLKGMKTINLLQSYDAFLVEKATNAIRWMCQYLDDDELLNELTWLHTFLLNCCKNDSGEGSLYNTVSSEINRLCKLDSKFIGGPVTFMVIISNIISSSDEAVKILESKLKTIKVTDFRGENIKSLTTQLTYVINRLQQTKLPDDLVSDLLKILQTSSNKEFNSTFGSVASLIRLKMIQPLPTWQTIFACAKEIYLAKVSKERWNTRAEGSIDSIFNATKNGKATFVCHICGGDHIGPNCTHCQNAIDTTPNDASKRCQITRRPDKNKGDTLTLVQHEDKKVRCWTRKDQHGNILKWCGSCKWNNKQGCWIDGTHAHFSHEHRFSWRGNNQPAANVGATETATTPTASGSSSGSDNAGSSSTATTGETSNSSSGNHSMSFSTSLRSFADATR